MSERSERAPLGLALRTAALAAPMDHVVCLRVSGAGAFDLVDRVSTAALFLLDGQMRQSLFLSDDGQPLADVTIARDDRDFFVLAELTSGTSAQALRAHLEDVGAGLHAEVEDLAATHALVGVHGPFAWEVTAAVLGPEVIGVPYLSFYRARGVVCFRGGKTGEFGYDLLVPRAEADALMDALVARGAPLGLVTASATDALAVLDAAALESWFFCVRTLSGWRGPALTPVELQLAWRVARGREFIGAAAVRAHAGAPERRRVTSFTAAAMPATNDVVTLGERPIGAVLAAARSAVRDEVVGVAVLDLPYACAGIDHFRAKGVALRTRTPPLIANRSLFVDPHRHSALVPEAYPPLVPPVLA